jgi:purine-binding chemotaxis protein CheW
VSAPLQQLVTFNLDEQHFALFLGTVERIVAMAEITPLPGAPAVVLGIVNIRGAIVPVIDIRQRFGLPARETRLTDRMLIARTSRRAVALIADGVAGVVAKLRTAIAPVDGIYSHRSKYVAGAVQLEAGLTLIHDLETLLSQDEERVLEQAIAPQ